MQTLIVSISVFILFRWHLWIATGDFNRVYLFQARLNNSNYDVYGTFQRFQIPIDRQEKTDEIV